MDHARRYVLHPLTSGAILTAIFGIAIATAKNRPAHFKIGGSRDGVSETIARLIRQWTAERRGCPSVIVAELTAQNEAASITALGRQSAVLPIHRAVVPVATPIVDILRSWALRKPVDDRING
jgi:hypothetical protein